MTVRATIAPRSILPPRPASIPSLRLMAAPGHGLPPWPASPRRRRRRSRPRPRLPISARRCPLATRFRSCSAIPLRGRQVPSVRVGLHPRRAGCPTTSIPLRRRPPQCRLSRRAPSTSSAGGAFEDLIPSAVPASIDSMFGLRPGRRAGSARGLHGRCCRAFGLRSSALRCAVDRSARAVQCREGRLAEAVGRADVSPTTRRSCARLRAAKGCGAAAAVRTG